jgi:hypothetical protein
VSRILCLCDEGVNRSVTIAHQLKYLGHDVLSAGLKTNSVDTLMTLAKWADHVIYTEPAAVPIVNGSTSARRRPLIAVPSNAHESAPGDHPRSAGDRGRDHRAEGAVRARGSAAVSPRRA